jgi:long-subunit acyl-CoA synthetase (AMP-forming)
VRRILEDVAEFKPTAFAGVPRVFDRIYAGAMARVRLRPRAPIVCRLLAALP